MTPIVARARRRNRSRLLVPLALLLAAAIDLAPAGASEQSEVLFTQGLEALRRSDLATARARLEEAAKADPSDAVARYWLGIACARDGDDRAAEAAFDEAIAIDPAYSEAVLSRGNARARLGEREAARRDWSRAAEIAVGTPVEREARRQMDMPRARGGKPRDWDASIGMGVEYDTNVVLFPNQGDAPLTTAGVPFRPSGPRSDTRFLYEVNAGYRFVDDDTWTVGTRQWLRAATQVRTEDVSFIDYSPSLYVNYKADPVTIGLQYTFTLFGEGGDMFLLRHQVEPSITVREGSQSWTRLWYRYANFDYRYTASATINQDGSGNTVGLDQYLLLFDKRGYARAGLAFERDLTQGSEYDASFFSMSAELLAPLPGDVFLRLQGEQLWGDYDNLSIYSRPAFLFYFGSPVRVGERQRQTLTEGSATLSRDFGSHWTLATRYTYYVNQSTVDAFDYNRSIYSLFASYRF